MGAKKGFVEVLELDRRPMFGDPQGKLAALRTGQQVQLNLEL